MLDIKFIRDNPDKIRQTTADKGFNAGLVDEVLKLDILRRETMQVVEKLRAERNTLTRADLDRAKILKVELKDKEEELAHLDGKFIGLLAQLPNPASPAAPVGKNDADNVEVKKWGTPRQFDFPVKDHLQLGTDLGIIDFESGAKVAGSQFYFLVGDAALLELALVRFAMDLLAKEGFTPVITPDVAKSRYYLGTGYQPRGPEAQIYTLEGEDLGLIATAEVTLAGHHADEIIPESKLPIKYIGYSHCFRQESGAYGKYSKGLYRVHQFTKAEMFIYCLPEDSDKYHQLMLSLEEKIYQTLEIPYRVLEMCTGDLGAMAVRKFDVEAWMPGRADYGEVTSTSNCTDFQARNLNIKFKRTSGETDYVHMLNGTAIATSRVPIAIFENFQNVDGTITIPEALRPYMGRDKITSPA